GFGVAVVALEHGRAGEVADLADRLAGVGERAVGVKLGAWALLPVLVEDRHVHVGAGHAERVGWRVLGPADHHGALATAVGLAGFHVEPPLELGAVVHGGLGAEDDAQLGLRLLRALGLREDVGERPAHVVDVG